MKEKKGAKSRFDFISTLPLATDGEQNAGTSARSFVALRKSQRQKGESVIIEYASSNKRCAENDAKNCSAIIQEIIL